MGSTSTCLVHQRATRSPLWGFQLLSSADTKEAQKLFVSVKAPQMWNQLPVELRTIGSFSCLRWSWNNTSWWLEVVIIVLIDVILVLSRFIVYVYAFAYRRSCLKMGFQPHLHTQLTNQSCQGCIFLSPACLYQMGLPYVLSIHFMPTCLYHTDNPSEIDFNFTFKSSGPTQQICILKYKLKLLFCHRRTKRHNILFCF